MTMTSRAGLCGLVLSGLLLLGAEARGETINVQYITFGEFFAEDGTSLGETFSTSGGEVVIQYFSNQTTSYDLGIGESTIGDFGEFHVLTSLPTDTEVIGSFELTILQVEPSFGTVEYTATLGGSLRIGRSGAFIDFDGPFQRQIGMVIYDLIEADLGVPGRVALVPASIDPGTGNLVSGVSSVEAQLTVIPEPSTMVLLGMGAVAPLGMMLRRRTKARNAS